MSQQLSATIAERQAAYLEEIKTSSSTIKSGAERILSRVETMSGALIKQIEALDTQARLLRGLVGTPASSGD
jgi:hypothetical protein